MNLPRYDPARTYRWNYDHPPSPVNIEVSRVAGAWQFAGLPVDSPIGIPAGPLLNGRWCLYYASLGFDVLTYKTVRSVARECYPLPNLVPVDCDALTGREQSVLSSDTMLGSWAVSFGMPSAAPDVWRRDVEWTRKCLPAGKVLNVSVVGTIQPGWSLSDLASDYAQCAKWAIESGADCVETNLSCPNVSTCDGQLYQNPPDAQLIARCVRDAIGEVPYVVKIGHVPNRTDAMDLLGGLEPYVDGLVMTNSISMVVMVNDSPEFNGQRRGICGAATRDASIAQVAMFSDLIRKSHSNMQLVACGGAATAEHVRQYLKSGAGAVHIATAAMTNPNTALEIKRDLAGEFSPSGELRSAT